MLTTNIILSQKTEFQKKESCPIKIKNSYSVTKENQNLSYPKFSPDGKKLLVSEKGYKGIYMIDLDDSNKLTTISKEPKVGLWAEWSKTNNEIKFNVVYGINIDNSYCNGNVESYYYCDCIPDHPTNVCCK